MPELPRARHFSGKLAHKSGTLAGLLVKLAGHPGKFDENPVKPGNKSGGPGENLPESAGTCGNLVAERGVLLRTAGAWVHRSAAAAALVELLADGEDLFALG